MIRNILYGLLASLTICIASCSESKDSGKDGYSVNQLYHSQNEDLLNILRKPDLIRFCSEKPHKVGHDGKHLNIFCYYDDDATGNVNFSLDDISYENVSKPVEEGDWFSLRYDQSSDRFYFHYIDLNNFEISSPMEE